MPDDDDPIMLSYSPTVTVTKCLEVSQDHSEANQKLCTGSLNTKIMAVNQEDKDDRTQEVKSAVNKQEGEKAHFINCQRQESDEDVQTGKS